jgi:O-antigen/teichoic acid export membrane protein
MEVGMNESRTLRRAFTGNAIFSLLSATIFVLAGGAIASRVGLSSPLPLQLVGAGLVPFGVYLLWLARRDQLTRRDGRIVSLLDAEWLLGTAILLVGWPELMNAAGHAAAIGIAAVVGGFAIWQWAGAQRILETR